MGFMLAFCLTPASLGGTYDRAKDLGLRGGAYGL